MELLNYKLIDTKNLDFTLLNFLFLIGTLFFTSIILRLIRKLVTRNLPEVDKNKFISVFQFIKYLVYVFAIMFTLDISGVDMKIFLTASAALFVGLGFALQTFF